MKLKHDFRTGKRKSFKYLIFLHSPQMPQLFHSSELSAEFAEFGVKQIETPVQLKICFPGIEKFLHQLLLFRLLHKCRTEKE